ncbi:oxidoreductase FAD-binding subunit [Nitratireductor indicus C115]|uniref:Oxidoreductase FAD-binding subunit n=1 Tax=Nitratireductor indicus C115 TaxID=1231190 RepID=K2P289_9HYPH|nr:2Fe-2S iron-sulfur cluster-binding protein [Nitratireductor indicus]EKF41481.1 oxidoreductase FAD-binding subunit [Nitratireductor indicus C115]SFQ69317.1 CDP-4-dehydro-6-deoxyglucose reductase/ferredoxin-NAD(P)+ reductase (naphthalene dioxygenase ferredoxin-specific) [Nitratireductor indicus]
MAKRIDIRQAARSILVPEGKTILEAALEEGIAYPHGCRSGRCGSCKSRLLDGKVDLLPHTPFSLTDEERAQGLILACRALPLADCGVAWLDEAEEQSDIPIQTYRTKVAAVDHLTHDIRKIRLEVAIGEAVSFKAGQYAQVRFNGVPARDYSMANQPGRSHFEFYIRHVPGGAASEHAVGTLRVGDKVLVRGPLGSAFLREQHTGPILAVAGGSGLAPIKSIVEMALASGLRQPIHLYFGARTARDLYLTEHFGLLASTYGNFEFVPVLSEERGSARFRKGFVTTAIAEDLPDLDGWKAYMAGPPAMIETAGSLLQDRGVRNEDIHADVFFTPEDTTI